MGIDGPWKLCYPGTKWGLGNFNGKLQTNGGRSMQVVRQELDREAEVLTINSKRMSTDGSCKSCYVRTKWGLRSFNGKHGCTVLLYTAVGDFRWRDG